MSDPTSPVPNGNGNSYGSLEDDYRPCPLDPTDDDACKGCVFSAPCPKGKSLDEIIEIFRKNNPEVK